MELLWFIMGSLWFIHLRPQTFTGVTCMEELHQTNRVGDTDFMNMRQNISSGAERGVKMRQRGQPGLLHRDQPAGRLAK